MSAPPIDTAADTLPPTERAPLPAKTVAAALYAAEIRRLLGRLLDGGEGRRWCSTIVDELRHAAQIAEGLAVLDDESAAADAKGLAERLKALSDGFAGAR